VEVFSRRLQVQERLTTEIASFMEEVLSPSGVAVLIDGYHMCIAMRGVSKSKARMITTSFRGVFKDLSVRNEFFMAIFPSAKFPDVDLAKS
jgi:GTP cyclohydrolase I